MIHRRHVDVHVLVLAQHRYNSSIRALEELQQLYSDALAQSSSISQGRTCKLYTASKMTTRRPHHHQQPHVHNVYVSYTVQLPLQPCCKCKTILQKVDVDPGPWLRRSFSEHTR